MTVELVDAQVGAFVQLLDKRKGTWRGGIGGIAVQPEFPDRLQAVAWARHAAAALRRAGYNNNDSATIYRRKAVVAQAWRDYQRLPAAPAPAPTTPTSASIIPASRLAAGAGAAAVLGVVVAILLAKRRSK